MKELYLGEHSEICKKRAKFPGEWPGNFCETTPESQVLFLRGEFLLIGWHRCMGFHHIDWMQEVLKELKAKKKPIEKLCRLRMDEALRDMRLRGKSMRNFFVEVHYVYSDAAGRTYGLYTPTTGAETLAIDNTILYEKTTRAIEYLKSHNNKERLIEDVKNLQYQNKLPYVPEAEMIRSTDHLIKTLKKRINESK